MVLGVFFPASLDFNLFNVDGAEVFFSFSSQDVELTVTYVYEPVATLEKEVEFTGPKSGNITVLGKVGKEYKLRRSTSLAIAASDVLDTKTGLGAPLLFSFDDSADEEATRAFFWIEESDVP